MVVVACTGPIHTCMHMDTFAQHMDIHAGTWTQSNTYIHTSVQTHTHTHEHSYKQASIDAHKASIDAQKHTLGHTHAYI